MNSNLNRALAAGLVAFGGAAHALAQFDWDGHCIDPNNSAPYSIGFNAYELETDLFGAGIGVSGTVAYATPYFDGCEFGGTAPVVGRIGFTIGPRGSIQDNDPNQDFGGKTDDFLRITADTNFAEEFIPSNSYPGPYFSPSVGGKSFARIYTQDQTTNAVNSYLYGSNGIRLGFIGRSGRYMYTDSTVDGTDQNNSIVVRCVIDVLADAARVDWTLTNRLNLNTANATGTPIGLGLYFGQQVRLKDQFGVDQIVAFGSGAGRFAATYTTIPGRRPLSVEERFSNIPVLTTNGVVESDLNPVPPYCNFSESQVAGFGLQVVNSAAALSGFDPAATIDQTQVDEFVLGTAGPGFLIDGAVASTDPQFSDFIFNPAGNGNADAAPISTFPAFLQKWRPNIVVAPAAAREIVAYYRGTSMDSSYGSTFGGYTVAADTPKSISTVSGDPTSFAPNPFTIRVNVDNTGGFSIVDQSITMQSVKVTLNLPAGMHKPNSTDRTITKTISNVDPGSIGVVDFSVAVDDTAFGSLPYSVVVEPQPSFASKTVFGNINVATKPLLLVRNGPNLVSPPWQFTDNTWSAILGLDLNADFQSYTWDASQQQYIPQTNAERGRGTWIISNDDLGFRSLGGTPRLPDDQFPDPGNLDVGGAPIVRLHRGWNLVGNPYNYSFDLGEIVGVPVGTTNQALQYNALVAAGYTDGSFTPFDQSTKSYLPAIQGAGNRLQPNAGYWLYANFDFDIKFPPIYDLFVRNAAPSATPFKQRFDNWRLQLSAASSGAADLSNFVGIARNAADAKRLTFKKAPLSPIKNAVRANVTGTDATWGQSQLLRFARGTQTFAYNVYSGQAGPVTVSWPNLKEIPSNLAVSIKDAVTGKSVNPRSVAGYSYTAKEKTTRAFTVTVTPQGTVTQRVGTATATQFRAGPVQQMKIAYTLSGRGGATIRVYKGKTLVGVAADDIDANAGANVFVWSMKGSNGLALDPGAYTLEIAATGEAGDTATRQIPITIRR